MKLTHEKINQLSHRIIDAIEALDEVEIFDEPNAIRLIYAKEVFVGEKDLERADERRGKNRGSRAASDHFPEADHP